MAYTLRFTSLLTAAIPCRRFQSLELALEAAESLGPDHYVIDAHGLQIWSPQRKLLRNEEWPYPGLVAVAC